MSRCTFTISNDTSTVTLSLPEWNSGEDNSISNDIRVLNFWDDDVRTLNGGIGNQPLVLIGVECASNSHAGLCVPYCVPYCFTTRLCEEVVERLDTMMDDGDAVTITELGDCQNGIYVIKDFTWATIRKNNYCYRWKLVLELKEEL